MFIDYVKVKVESGAGGSGCISFRREKFVPRGGPNGGDGGKGGDIIFRADPELATLLDLKMSPFIRSKRGGHGQGTNKSGRGGEDIVIDLPLGSVIHEGDTLLADLTQPGQSFVAARGGRGGRGNQHFATPSDQAPRRFEPGWPGQMRTLVIELKQIADVGLIGLPNAGKSTLLARLTAAHPKIAPYPFTTLHPNLGVIEDPVGRHITVADLPGLIEGASRGEGLGHRFLRHVERTRLLAQLVAFDGENPGYDDMRYQLDLVGDELSAYSEKLTQKKRLLILSKIDLCGAEEREKIIQRFRQDGFKPICISADSGEGIEQLKDTFCALALNEDKDEGQRTEG